MRKVTEKAANALKNMRATRSGNTAVILKDFWLADDNVVPVAVMELHGNEIAIFDGELLTIKDAGWQSNTTKERLNGILTAFGITGGISQKDYVWYFVDGHWQSEATDDNPWAGHYVETLREHWNGTKQFRIGA